MLIYFLPTILALGIITSYEDIKEGKIRNRYLLAAIALGIATRLVLIFFGITDFHQFAIQSIGTMAALATAVFIWYIKWWSAGDAKLFATYYFLLPIPAFIEADTTFRILTLLVNMVLPIWVFLFFTAIISQRKRLLPILKLSIQPRQILSLLLLVISVPRLIDLTSGWFGLQTNFLITMALLMVISMSLQKYLGNKDQIVYGVVLALRIIFDSQFFQLNTLTNYLPWLVGYYIVRYFIMGIMLTDSHQRRKSIKQPNKMLSWLGREDGTVPFAPLMFLGTLITILIGRGLETFIISIFM